MYLKFMYAIRERHMRITVRFIKYIILQPKDCWTDIRRLPDDISDLSTD